jgi:hypothetical protein
MDVDEYAVPSLAILRVNKQIRSEAEPVYFSKNLFVLPHHWEKRKPFVEDVPKGGVDRHLFSEKARHYLRNISIGYSSLPEAVPCTNMSSDWSGETIRPNGFDSMSSAERLQVAHFEAKLRLLRCWVDMFDTMNLKLSAWPEYLEVDFTNAYCPVGCCRMALNCCRRYYLPLLEATTVLVRGLRNDDEEAEFLSLMRNIRGNGDVGEMKKTLELEFDVDEEPWAAWKVAATLQHNDQGREKEGVVIGRSEEEDTDMGEDGGAENDEMSADVGVVQDAEDTNDSDHIGG